MQCAFCERPLICDGCGIEYQPADLEQYRARSMGEAQVLCRGCGQPLVCHWCKTPYDGSTDADEGEAAGSEAPGD